MKHMDRKFPKGNSLLREHTESTLEKQQKARQDKKKPPELNVANKYNKLQELENKRMKRKEMLSAMLNKIHDPDIA